MILQRIGLERIETLVQGFRCMPCIWPTSAQSMTLCDPLSTTRYKPGGPWALLRVWPWRHLWSLTLLGLSSVAFLYRQLTLLAKNCWPPKRALQLCALCRSATFFIKQKIKYSLGKNTVIYFSVFDKEKEEVNSTNATKIIQCALTMGMKSIKLIGFCLHF